MFKQINDNFGHQTGDNVLKFFGQLSRSFFHDQSVLGRIGGEEFLFILEDQSLNQSKLKLTEFCQQVNTIANLINLPSHIEHTLITSVSVGLVQYISGDTSQTILNRADNALYDAKGSGRNKLVLNHLTERRRDSN